ncbi:MAG: lipopolysaccharide biosynthesis protein [Chloroflexi bacterium]|nr:lipopolysaccharide biosynthesis protein [Chloroflexota bacterium]
MSLKRQVGSAIVWVILSVIFTRFLSFLTKLVLARFLAPGDFGLRALANPAINLLMMFQELGFTSALIYRQTEVEEAADTAFWTVLTSSLTLYLVGFFSAPWVADFFHEPQLIPVMRVLALTMLLSSFAQVPVTLLVKELAFKRKVIPDLIAGVLGNGLSIVLAMLGYGVWSLVYGQVAVSLIAAGLIWFFTPWRPRLRFSKARVKELIDYGKHIVGSQTLVFAITNVDNVFVGKFLATATLGFYDLAYTIANLPATQITRLVNQVMFPTFSKVQSDLEMFRNVYFRALKYVSLLSVPIAVTTIGFADNFVTQAYGREWSPAILPMQLLGIYGLVRSVAANMGNVFKAGGQPKWLTYIALWRLTMMLIFLYPAIRWGGIVGVSLFSAIISVIDFGISVFLANKIIHASWGKYVQILVPQGIASVIAVLAGKLVYWNTWGLTRAIVRLGAAGVAIVVVYAAIMWAIDPEVRQLAQAAWEFVRLRGRSAVAKEA